MIDNLREPACLDWTRCPEQRVLFQVGTSCCLLFLFFFSCYASTSELKLLQSVIKVCFYIVLYTSPRLGEGWALTNMFIPPYILCAWPNPGTVILLWFYGLVLLVLHICILIWSFYHHNLFLGLLQLSWWCGYLSIRPLQINL